RSTSNASTTRPCWRAAVKTPVSSVTMPGKASPFRKPYTTCQAARPPASGLNPKIAAPASVETPAWPARSRHSSIDGPGPRPLLPSLRAAKTRATNGPERSPANAKTVTGRQGWTGVIGGHSPTSRGRWSDEILPLWGDRCQRPASARSGSWLRCWSAFRRHRVTRSLTHRFLHQRADSCLFGGGQLLQREGGRPHGAFVEVRLV